MFGFLQKNRQLPEEKALAKLYARFRTESDVFGIESTEEKLLVCQALFRHPHAEVAEAAVSVYTDPAADAAKSSKILADLSDLLLSDDVSYSLKAKAARVLLEQLHASASAITDYPTLQAATEAFIAALEKVRGTFSGSHGEALHYLLPVLSDAVRRGISGFLFSIATTFGLSDRLLDALGAIAEDKSADGSTRYNAVVLLASFYDMRCVPVLQRVSETKIVDVGENAKLGLARLDSTVLTFMDAEDARMEERPAAEAVLEKAQPDEASVFYL